MFGNYEDQTFIWNRTGVYFDEIPTLQRLIRCCNMDALARMVRVIAAQEQAIGSGDHPELERFFRAELDRFLYMDVNDSTNTDDWVLLPLERFSVDEKTLHLVREVKAVRTLLRAVESSSFAWSARLEGSFADVPVDQVLSYRVWMGDSLGVRERYMMIASAVWEVLRRDFLWVDLGLGTDVDNRLALVWLEENKWGLGFREDFDQGYRQKLSEMAEYMNEQAWIRFQEERSYFADVVLAANDQIIY